MDVFDNYLITATREKPTLDATIKSLVDAGFVNLRVFGDLDSTPPTHWRGVSMFSHSDVHLGPWGALRRCLKRAAIDLDRPPASAICIFQDDILMAKGAAEWLYEQLLEAKGGRKLKDAGALSLYSCQALTDGITESGWHEVMPEDLPRRAYGACALAFPREVAFQILENPPHPDEPKRADLHIGTFCKNSGRPWMHHVPSLVQHVGETSVAHAGAPLDHYRCANQLVTDCREIAAWSNSSTQPASLPVS